MNNIYKQKADKYKYKYLKLKQKYIAEGGDFSDEDKTTFFKLRGLMSDLEKREDKLNTKKEIKSILAEITDVAFIESLSKALIVRSDVPEYMVTNNKDSIIFKMMNERIAEIFIKIEEEIKELEEKVKNKKMNTTKK